MSGVLPATFLEVVLFEIFKLETVHLSIELCQMNMVTLTVQKVLLIVCY